MYNSLMQKSYDIDVMKGKFFTTEDFKLKKRKKPLKYNKKLMIINEK